ncbi:MAG: tagaturonate reductase, partial [Bacteroidota bacterium]
MKKLTRSNIEALPNKPIKIVQFGEGNFLRAFADWVVDIMNERIGFNAGVAVVQPIETGLVELLQRQDGLYHHLMMGMSSGERIRKFRLISCIQHTVNPFQDKHAFWELAAGDDLEIVISNTTEAGIVFDESDLPKKGVLAHTFPG